MRVWKPILPVIEEGTVSDDTRVIISECAVYWQIGAETNFLPTKTHWQSHISILYGYGSSAKRNIYISIVYTHFIIFSFETIHALFLYPQVATLEAKYIFPGRRHFCIHGSQITERISV